MRVRAPRLTYANVTATLALVLALGGTTYAATNVTSRQIVNGTIRGVDVRKDSLSGVQVNESKLGPINRARSAKTADQLAGLDPSFYEKSSRILFGRLLGTQVGVFANYVAWPEMGIAVQTDGDADDRADVRLQSTRVAGSNDMKVTVLNADASGNVNLAPGATAILESQHAGGSVISFVVTDNGGTSAPGQAMWVTCKANNHGATQDGQVFCFAIKSLP
jgi:hypothetical protein